MFPDLSSVGADIGNLVLRVSEIIKARARMVFHSKQMSEVRLSDGLSASSHVVVTLVHNEEPRLAYFLKFYRSLGFNHFIFIDNQSTDGSLSFLRNQQDVSLFSATGSYKNARFGMDWINLVLTKFCCGKWILHVDADEFLCFPGSVGEKVQNLTDYLDSRNEPSINCLLLDMYSDTQISENILSVDRDPIEVLSYYDASGYLKIHDPNTHTTWIKGGVRGRKFFSRREWEGPALNKTPLIKWKKSYAFLKSAHQVWPFSLNRGSCGKGRITGALLHTKFLSDFIQKIKMEQERRQHSEEYDAYIFAGDSSQAEVFMDINTKKFEGWRSLAQDGLIIDPYESRQILSEKPNQQGEPTA